jgi:peptide chain release factor 1
MWDKLEDVEQRYVSLSEQLYSPEIASNPEYMRKVSKEHKDLTPIVEAFKLFKTRRTELEGAKEVVYNEKDPEMVELAKLEVAALEIEIADLQEQLRLLLIPKDPNDDKNVIMEIRAGAGGDEASIFAGDLFRLYSRYAEVQGWKIEVMSISDGTSGGFKEIICSITGAGAFSRFKFESGVHRVQRVPATETQGRIHTSTITVAVLPEAEEIDLEILDKDLRIDVYRSGGCGGQSVNTTDSAVRITHIPTGIVVAMQDEKSQHKNKEKGMKILRSRLLQKRQDEADAARSSMRRSQVGTGDRSEKIRTYNYPQSRISDHRIGLTLHSLATIMNGDLDQLINPLTTHYQAEALKGEAQQ